MYTYTEEDLRQAVRNSASFSQVLSNLNLSKTGASYNLIQNKIKKLSIDCRHFTKYQISGGNSKKHFNEILVKSEYLSSRVNGYKLRRALLEYGREYRCEHCSNTGIWNDKDIILEIDHIDGDWRNNLPENLRFLCPNCHSQTSNFYRQVEPVICSCGRKKSKLSTNCHKCSNKNAGDARRKVERPSKEELEILVWELPTTNIAERYSVSDKAVDKWCKSYQINKPPRGYWQKKACGK